MVIIKSRRVGTPRWVRRSSGPTIGAAREMATGGVVWGLADGGARTEYFNFLRGCAAAVQSRSRRELERFGWPVWPGVDRGRSWGVSLDGRTPDFHPLSGSGATPSAPTSPPPPSLHHHSDCEQTDCEYSVVARSSLAEDALSQINFRRRLDG